MQLSGLGKKSVLIIAITSLLIISGCSMFVTEKIKTPEIFSLKKNKYTEILSELDQWQFDGSIELKKKKYKIKIEDSSSVDMTIEKGTIMTVNVHANMEPYEEKENKFNLTPQFNNFYITFSKSIEISHKGEKLADVFYISSEDDELISGMSVNIANAFGNSITSTIFKDDQIDMNNMDIPKIEFGKVTITKVIGEYHPGSVFKTKWGNVTNTTSGHLILTHFTRDKNNVLKSDIDFQSGSLNFDDMEIDSKHVSAELASFNFIGHAKYSADGVELSSGVGGLSIELEKIKLNDSKGNVMQIERVDLNTEKTKVILSRDNKVLDIKLDSKLIVGKVLYKSDDGELEVSSSDLLHLAYKVRTNKEIIGHTLSSKEGLVIDLNKYSVSSATGLVLKKIKLKTEPFTISRLSDINISIKKINLGIGEIIVNSKTVKPITIIPESDFNINFKEDIVLGLFKDKPVKNLGFSLQGDVKKLLLKDNRGEHLITGFAIDAESVDGGVSGVISVDSFTTKLAGQSVYEMISKGSAEIKSMNFIANADGFNIINMPMKVSIPKSLIIIKAKNNLKKPLKTSFAKLPFGDVSHDFLTYLTPGSAKDHRLKTQVVRVGLLKADFKGTYARVEVNGDIRAEVETYVAKTRSAMCSKNGTKPCIKRTIKSGVTLDAASTCLTKWKTKCSEIYHKWVSAAAVTLNVAVTADIKFNPTNNQPLGNFALNPKIKVVKINIKSLPGWLDKNLISPVTNFFIATELDKVDIFARMKQSTRDVLNLLTIRDVRVTENNKNVIFSFNLSGNL